jgi:hypothetical protein
MRPQGAANMSLLSHPKRLVVPFEWDASQPVGMSDLKAVLRPIQEELDLSPLCDTSVSRGRGLVQVLQLACLAAHEGRSALYVTDAFGSWLSLLMLVFHCTGLILAGTM